MGQQTVSYQFAESLEVSIKRFGIEHQLALILARTAHELGWFDEQAAEGRAGE